MTQHLDDIELIRQFRDRDHEVFEQLVGEYRDELIRHARRKLGNDGSAEDAVQETFLRAYRSSHRLRDDSRLRPWLHHILANVCIDEANRRQRQRFLADRVERDPSVATTTTIEEELRLDIDASPVRKALDSLPPTHQQAIVMRFVDDLDYGEIASVSGTSEQNVRARVSRARTVLRAAYRGAAAVPLFVIGVLRRGRTATAAAEKADTIDRLSKVEQAGRAATVSAEGASGVTRMAASMAPAMETATTVAMSAQASAPTIGKAAAGIGALALAAMSTGSEAPPRITAPPPIEIAAETEAVGAAEPPAPAPAPAPAAPAPTVQASGTADETPAPSAGPTEPVGPGTTPEPLTDGATAIDDAADTAAEATEPDVETIVPETSAPEPVAAAPIEAPAAPEPEPEVDEGAAADADAVVEAPPVDGEAAEAGDSLPDDGSGEAGEAGATEPAPEETEPVVEEPPAPVLSGGSISVGGLALTPAGPRFDLSGSAALSIGGTSFNGSLSGRFGLNEPDADGRRRLDGVVTVNVNGSAVEIRLAGHATPLDGDAETPATSFSVSGQFRTTGGAAVSLVERGGFSGSFGPGNLSLNLTP